MASLVSSSMERPLLRDVEQGCGCEAALSAGKSKWERVKAGMPGFRDSAEQEGKIIVDTVETDTELGVLKATGVPAYFRTICISVVIVLGFSGIYQGCMPVLDKRSRNHQGLAWLLFLIDLVLLIGMTASIECVLLFWSSAPKWKQEVKDLRSRAIEMLNQATNYKNIMIHNLNVVEVRVFRKAFNIKTEAELDARQALKAAESTLDKDWAAADKVVNDFMKQVENKIGEGLDKAERGAGNLEKMAVQKAREAEDMVEEHVNEVIGQVEGKISAMLSKAISVVSGALDEVNAKLDKMVSKVPCAFRSCARSAADDTKSSLHSKYDAGRKAAVDEKEAAFGEVHNAVQMARQKADEKLDEADKFARQEITTAASKVRWSVQKGEKVAEEKVHEGETLIAKLVKVSEQKADAAEKKAEAIADEKFEQIESLVEEKTKQLEVNLDKQWKDTRDRLLKQIDDVEADMLMLIKRTEQIVKSLALPFIAFQFTIVLWTTWNMFVAGTA